MTSAFPQVLHWPLIRTCDRTKTPFFIWFCIRGTFIISSLSKGSKCSLICSPEVSGLSPPRNPSRGRGSFPLKASALWLYQFASRVVFLQSQNLSDASSVSGRHTPRPSRPSGGRVCWHCAARDAPKSRRALRQVFVARTAAQVSAEHFRSPRRPGRAAPGSPCGALPLRRSARPCPPRWPSCQSQWRRQWPRIHIFYHLNILGALAKYHGQDTKKDEAGPDPEKPP